MDLFWCCDAVNMAENEVFEWCERGPNLHTITWIDCCLIWYVDELENEIVYKSYPDFHGTYNWLLL